MIRALWVLTLLGVTVIAVIWLSDNPGQLQAQWHGYSIETSAAVLVIVVVLLAAMAALLYRGWLSIKRTPSRVATAWRERRRRRGYEALTKGMVAVAAGDSGEAQKQAKRADVLLNEPPLTMLLSAQSAQLGGDDRAAEGFFKAMTEKPETEFLGLRGLLSQSIKRGETQKALELARRAYRLQPKSEWVATTLFDLQIDAGLWLDASVTNDELGRRRLRNRHETDRHKAVLAFEQSRSARGREDRAEEMRLLRQAQDLAPDLVPATVRLAECLSQAGKERRALGLVEKAWIHHPHPDLAAVYTELRQPSDALAAVKMIEKLVRSNPGHPESLLALASAAIEAGLWGEARKHLQPVVDGGGIDGFFGRGCRMMAAVEDKELQDHLAAREWLTRAAHADPDRLWVCSACGNATTAWTVTCGNCGQFDTYVWGTPPHVGRLSDRQLADPGSTPQLPAPAVSDDP